MAVLRGAQGVLFDKDGTLVDFAATWSEYTRRVLEQLSHGDSAIASRLATLGGFDLASGAFTPNSPVVAGTLTEISALWADALDDWSPRELEIWLDAEAVSSAATSAAPAARDLPGLLDRLAAAGLALGVATHDSETSARQQLKGLGALDRFRFLAGYDSGFAPKPTAGMLEGFAAATGLSPGAVVVVGDSLHDLRMGRAGGALATVGVLTGPAGPDVLAAEADLVLPSIEDLPEALGL